MTAMPGLRQRHMDRTRAAIVDAALSLLAEKGFTETTVDAIAERAEVARRTFFRYFPAKEDVLFHDVDEQIALVIEALVARPEEEPPYEALVPSCGRQPAGSPSTSSAAGSWPGWPGRARTWSFTTGPWSCVGSKRR